MVSNEIGVTFISCRLKINKSYFMFWPHLWIFLLSRMCFNFERTVFKSFLPLKIFFFFSGNKIGTYHPEFSLIEKLSPTIFASIGLTLVVSKSIEIKVELFNWLTRLSNF